MHGLLSAGEAIVLTLWVGSLWAVGYLVAPTLFATLEDRALAGRVAGELFTVETWLGLACGALLVSAEGLRARRWRWDNPRLALPVAMMLALAASEFLVRPMMAAARGELGADSERFALLHGVSSVLYLSASVLGLFLVAGARSSRNTVP